MNNNKLARSMRAFTASLLVAALAGCGGGDDPPPAAVALAVDDTASVDWNTATTLAVITNDTVKNGTATLAIKTAPAHGSATVSGTEIRYTPTTGYIGSDSLRYSLTVGDRTVDAGVQLTVAAQLKLSGTVRDDPLPGAVVTATVGTTVLAPVTADGSGNYSVNLRITDPAALISLSARGAGTQSKVVLTSLVGDGAEAVAAAVSGAVSAAALPAANVTHVSTAIAVLSQQALGKAITSTADLKAVQGLVTPTQTIEMAAAIKLVADSGVALPADSADTLALVSKPETLKSFLLAQLTANPEAYNAVLQKVLGDPLMAGLVAVPTTANPAPITLLRVQGEGAFASSASRLTLQSDGVAIEESDSVMRGKWTSSGGDITVRYDTPTTVESSTDSDAQGRVYKTLESVVGFVVRRLGGGGAASALVSVKSLETTTYLEGPLQGSVTSRDGEWDAQTLVGSTSPITASDLATGTRWAGVMAAEALQGEVGLTQDVLRIVDASTVSFERSGRSGSYRLVDGKLELTVGTSVVTYSRLFNGPRGEQRWLAVKTVGGAVQWVYELAMFKPQADPGALTVANLVQRWESYINVGLIAGKFEIDLRADGSGRSISTDGSGVETIAGGRGLWSVGSDGVMSYRRYSCDPSLAGCQPFQQRTWTLLGTVGKRIYVMERLIASTDQTRLNVYTRP